MYLLSVVHYLSSLINSEILRRGNTVAIVIAED